MNRNFHEYQIQKKEKKAEVKLLDVNENILEILALDIVTEDELYELFSQEMAFNFDSVYIENFNLKKIIAQKHPDGRTKTVIHGINICNSIIYSESEIDFSHLSFTDTFKISQSFILQSLNLSHSEFKTQIFSIDNSLFQAPRLNLENAIITSKELSLKNTIFKKTEKNFQNMQINSSMLNCVSTDFGGGDLLFTGTKFSEGRKSFKVAQFGNGRKDFSNVAFNNGDVSFEMTNFGSGTVNFRTTIFGSGKVEFLGAEFGDGDINFVHTIFSDGTVSFKNTNFGNGKVAFKLVEFGTGLIDFHFSVFHKGDLQFDRTNFGSDSVDFRAVNFGDGKVSFNKCKFYHGDLILEASELKNNQLTINQCIFEQTNLNVESINFENSGFQISDSDLQTAKISFKGSKIKNLIMNNIQIENYVDLRLDGCEYLDLSDTIIKGILNITPDNYSTNISNINLSGMRLLGRIYLDWEQSKIKEIILNQDSNYYLKAEQFRILKQNYNSIGQYDSEDYAYVEFKRAEAKAKLYQFSKSKPLLDKIIAYNNYFFKLIIFDKVGKYATDPIRVLLSMLITYVFFSILYIGFTIISLGDIHSSLFAIDDPRNLNLLSRALYHSAVTFLTIGYGDFYPSGINRIISGLEGFIGLFLMSYFTVAFVRKILR